MRTDEGTILAQDWAAGFPAAVRLRLEAWLPLLDGPAWMKLLLPILVHTPDPTIEAQIARLPAEAKHHLAEAYRHIPTAVAALRGHLLPARLAAGAGATAEKRWGFAMPARDDSARRAGRPASPLRGLDAQAPREAPGNRRRRS